MVGDLRGEGCTVKAGGIGMHRGLSNSTSIVSSATSFIWKRRTVQGSTVRSTNMLITI